MLLCRSFSTAVFYSPFIGGMALALHYAPGSKILAVMSFGAVLALTGLALGYAHARRCDAGGLSRFEGYPLRYRNLAFPALLAVAVMGWHLADPAFPVLVLIAGLAPAMALAVLAGTRGPLSGLRAMVAHGRVELPGMAGEVALFLAAGMLAVGLTSALAVHDGLWLPSRFDAGTASGLVFGVYALSFVGVHPVVPLTIAATLLAPLDPDPTLMVMSFVMGWGIGCAGNPLSGQVLILQARYGGAGVALRPLERTLVPRACRGRRRGPARLGVARRLIGREGAVRSRRGSSRRARSTASPAHSGRADLRSRRNGASPLGRSGPPEKLLPPARQCPSTSGEALPRYDFSAIPVARASSRSDLADVLALARTYRRPRRGLCYAEREGGANEMRVRIEYCGA